MEFTTLNDNFTNRMNDENREVNEKNVNEKRLENRPPGDKYPKREADKQFKENCFYNDFVGSRKYIGNFSDTFVISKSKFSLGIDILSFLEECYWCNDGELSLNENL
ncbi:hypothetical protein RhiirA4_479346 [Rhizophagus irregularis]|uniref:Uncharacterized protein n=1 Tax=Rhizophagus irregularis TaxID=588596 RepID=A0A2I1HGG1_9GLOM|nr:hypothetical protein RhiirA4_479346 [Rhizophagus irregularis]